MTSHRTRIETTILPLVVKPNRYVGNYVAPDDRRFESAAVRAVVVHPDVFEIGFGDRDTRDAHTLLNALDGVAADLTFLPWPDLLERLFSTGAPLWGVESLRPLAEFDLILFTPSTPLQFLHLPRLLEASGLPPRALDRDESAPIVAAVGNTMGNPAPIADFLDAVLLGEPCAVLSGVVSALTGTRGARRGERCAALFASPGVLDPARIPAPGHAFEGAPAGGARLTVYAPRPVAETVVPLVEVSDDGIRLDIRLGGVPRAHEFNWRSSSEPWILDPEEAADRVTAALKATGLDRVDFTGDHPEEHPGLSRLAEALVRRHPDLRISIADFGTAEPTAALARELNRGRRSTYAWSPLAGSDRLRSRLGVPYDETRFLEAVATAKRGGCHQARFRFGIGWPGEEDEDVAALCELVRSIRAQSSVSASPPRYQVFLEAFVPGAHTALQDAPLLPVADIEERIAAVRRSVEQGPVQVKVTPPTLSRFEALLARGGRDLGAALVAAAKSAATTPTPRDAWNEAPWVAAFAAAGFDPDRDTAPPAGTPRPWDILTPGARIVEAPRIATPAAALPAEPETSSFGRRTRRKPVPGSAAAVKQAARYRIRYAKGEAVRFISHLDVGRAFERALRRVGMSQPSARGKGVKLSFGPPLPLGMTGSDEYLDLVFAEEVPETVPAALAALLPTGLSVEDSRPVRASVDSLAHAIDRAHYEVSFPPEVIAAVCPEGPAAFLNVLENGVRWMLAEKELSVPKSPDDELNRVDVRPGLLSSEVEDRGDVPVLRLHVMLGTAHAPRPESLLPVLLDRSFDPRLTRIHRTALRISGSGREFTPLEVVELDFPWWRETMKRRAAGQRS